MDLELELAKRLLTESRVVAVLGAHHKPSRAGHYVAAYLQQQGYRVLPVNPRYVGKELFGEPVVAKLADLEEPVDVVDVFRNPSTLPDHLEDIFAMDPPPKAVWLQSGIRHDAFAAQLRERGIAVVQNRCTYADHRSFGLPRVA
jgi:predicted CoA-binding protein